MPRWSTGGPLPRLHVVRRALTNRTTTAGSGRCAESEAAAIVTKVTAGQYVKLQVWTTRCPSLTQADGTRVHAVLGTVASASTCISLRVPARGGLSLEDCVASGSLTPGVAQLLSRMIQAKLAFLISGGTGSGNPLPAQCASWRPQPPERPRASLQDRQNLRTKCSAEPATGEARSAGRTMQPD